MESDNFWKILLGVSVLVLVYSLASFPQVYTNISGDGIPNRPQKELLIENQWDAVFQKIILIALSIGVGLYSFNQIRIR
jgi:hypothetical protein